MSVVGFDVGNESGVVGVARQRGIDVVLNEESKRETPMLVSFGESQRFLGVAGAATATMNPKNTVSQIKRLIGRKFSDPEVQKDIPAFPFKVTEGADGEILINVTYLNEARTFTPTQVLAMALSNLKLIAESNLGASVQDCVLGIPVYFTDAQRRAYLDAATIAGLNPLRLMHEPTATALAYGIYKTDLSDTEPLHVAFVDVGHSCMQVTIAAFKKGQLKILAHAYDRSLGGRDFDEVLFNHFADLFKAEYKIDVRSNAKASLRLRVACEKLKKVLSANPEAPLNIECLMDEKDVRGFMKRDDFENLAAPILERVLAPCQKALAESGLTTDQLNSMELVGSGSRTPSVVKILSNFFGKEPRRTLNASECIARGCALQCAMLSPTFKVREFEVQDIYPAAIALSWKQAAPSPEDEGEEAAAQPNQIVFTKGNAIPSSKLLTFYRTETFTIDAFYADPSELPAGSNPKIGTFTVGPFSPSLKENSKPKLKVKIRLNLHGILSVESATLLEEEEVEVAVKKDSPAPMETDKEAAAGGESIPADPAEAKMEDPSPGDVGADVAKEVVKKKKTKRTDVPIEAILTGGLPTSDLTKATEVEYEMALQDRVMEETKEKKNAVEAYVYDMRNKLYDKLQDYVTEEEKNTLIGKLQETEDWLYEDGENESKGVYIAKLAELKKMGDPVESRLKEEEQRQPAVESLQYCLRSFRDAALSPDPRYDHIDPKDKTKVVEECSRAEAWLKDAVQRQSHLSRKQNPVLITDELKKKAEALDRFCKPIMTKPRPSAPKPSTTAPPPGAEKKAEDKSGAGEPMDTEGGAGPQPTPGEGEAMQTE